MRIELNTNDESVHGLRHLAGLLLALAGETVAPAKPTSAIGAIVEAPQATVGQNGASSQPVISAGEAAGNEAGAEASAGTPADDAPAASVTRKRRTKAEMEAARAAEAGNVSAAATETDTGSTAGASTNVDAAATGSTSEPSPGNDKALTLDDVRAALQRYTEKTSMQHAIVLLKNYGASRISELNAEQYGLFIAECDAKE